MNNETRVPISFWIRIPANGTDEKCRAVNISRRAVFRAMGTAAESVHTLEGRVFNYCRREFSNEMSLRLNKGQTKRNFYQSHAFDDNWEYTPQGVAADDSGYEFVGVAISGGEEAPSPPIPVESLEDRVREMIAAFAADLLQMINQAEGDRR